jgi:hypothetical protein
MSKKSLNAFDARLNGLDSCGNTPKDMLQFCGLYYASRQKLYHPAE